jgi:hypothetical protein
MSWVVRFAPEFAKEFEILGAPIKVELLAQAKMVEHFGPQTGRPRVDTLKGSKHANMKELRFDADGGVWRVAFAFDPMREAVLLVAGDKTGGSEARFYRTLIATADRRFDLHLSSLEPPPAAADSKKSAKTRLRRKQNRRRR